MYPYSAPLDDFKFMILEVLKQNKAAPSDPSNCNDSFFCDEGTVDAVLKESAKFCEETLFPLNRLGDKNGAIFKNGSASFPAGFREAYAAFVEGGWPSFSCDELHGGQGLPHLLNMPLTEMICSSNLAFGVTPALTRGAYTALVKFGSEQLNKMYLADLASGKLTATMCLTEPQAGTDLGLIRTTALPDNDNQKFFVSGTKIFISGGDHDLTENILHLVLAKLPGSPKGAKGITLLAVPKFRTDSSGKPSGSPNGVTCESIENKMGLHASPTCCLRFENAEGHIVGKANEGLKAMFVMMNEARIYVGVQGIGLAEAARQQALAYSKERRQGRSPSAPAAPHFQADPLISLPDVRRMLLHIRSMCEAGRLLSLTAAWRTDESEKLSPGLRKQNAEDFLALTTPIIKAFFSDAGFACTNMAMQIFGGHGYIKESGMEQFVRDARVAQIYEGANGVQALDLVARKLSAHGGRALRTFFRDACEEAAKISTVPGLETHADGLSDAIDRTRRATFYIAEHGAADPAEVCASAYDYLNIFGLSLCAWMHAMMAHKAIELLRNKNGAMRDEFYERKLVSSRFFMEKILPEQEGLLRRLIKGGDSITGPTNEKI